MANVFKKLSDSDRNPTATLYFGNIDPQVTELLMYELFIQFGPVRSINVPKDRILKTHQGYGFVEFRSSLDAGYTLDILRGVRLFGKLLKLKKIDQGTGGVGQQGTGPMKKIGQMNVVGQGQDLLNPNYIDVGAKLFINNLSPLVDEKFLFETFGKFGNLIRYPIIRRDIETGQSMGYGFLTYDDFTTSDLVIEKMNNTILMNNKISISYAFKEDTTSGQKKARTRHGDKVERLLAESAKANNLLITKKLKTKKKQKVTKPQHHRKSG
ncbi:uncharacterized protein J8A68_003321 [[Candida] subhashii]|uniref:RRM domain-containing protein n=1 Tax=[Candida] subhashii TaxID=561895 RepID=A0A8J5QMM0_9ASCO|nr:uncharacterized protein J8A68_003321 [[Candida] subhashii]KAG7663143.1 hypothetical protein J8A68_003321 [[Candida] subhashii]